MIIQPALVRISEQTQESVSPEGCNRLLGRYRNLAAELARYVDDERGQSATEYILVTGLVVVPLAIAFNELQDALRELADKLAKLLYGPGV